MAAINSFAGMSCEFANRSNINRKCISLSCSLLNSCTWNFNEHIKFCTIVKKNILYNFLRISTLYRCYMCVPPRVSVTNFAFIDIMPRGGELFILKGPGVGNLLHV